MNITPFETAYWIIAAIIIVLYILFAPEAFFHKTYRKENPKLFDRWKDKRLMWNIHQSFIHFVGSLIGFIALYILLFKLGIGDPNEYSLSHLLLLLLGLAGIMGFLPRIFFGSTIGKS